MVSGWFEQQQPRQQKQLVTYFSMDDGHVFVVAFEFVAHSSIQYYVYNCHSKYMVRSVGRL